MRKHLLFLSVMLTMAALPAFAQTVTGRVTSSSDNSALPGVSVMLKGTTRGTSTDADGNYSLNVAGNEGGTLVVSFIGYSTQEVSAQGRTVIDVVLQEDISQLGEVVITGFGETKETSKVSYAVQEVKGGELSRTNAGNPINAMQGKVAGVMIDQGTGGPMSSSRIRIRGNASLSTNTQPLFVIDGVLIRPAVTGSGPWGDGQDFGNIMKNINPDNIESMTVLKGSAASALYGSDALNGVVLITTKKGVERSGIGVTYNHTTSFEKAYKFVDVQNEFGGGASSTFVKDTDGVDLVERGGFWPYSYGPKFDGRMVRDMDGRMVKWEANDPLDFFETGKYINNNITLDGGNDRSTFRASFSNLYNTSITPSSTRMTRNNVNINATHKIGKVLDIALGIDYTRNEMKNPIRQGGNSSPVFGLIYNKPRHLDINYWMHNYEDVVGGGRKRGGDDPFQVADFLWNTFEDNVYRDEDVFRGNIDLKAHVTPWLDAIVRANIQNEEYADERKKLGADPLYAQGIYSQSQEVNRQYRVQGLLTANKQVSSDFFVSATIGGETNRNIGGRNYKLETRGGLRIVDNFSIKNGIEGINVTTQYVPSKLKNAFYAYGDVTWRDQVTLTWSHRTDFSSTLAYADGSGDWSYSYPAGGLAWTFTETFQDQLPTWISRGKVRANFGVTGGDTDPWTLNRTGSYSGQNDYITPDGRIAYFSFYDNVLGNPGIKNRQGKEWEIGTDFSLLENRISVDVAYYNKTVENEIFKLSQAIESGVSDRLINGGKIQNKGIEVVLRATPIRTQNVEWTTMFNFSRNRNYVKELSAGVTQFELATAFGTDVASVARPGEEYGVIVSNMAYAHYQKKDGEGNPIDHPSNGQRVIGNGGSGANALTYLRSGNYGQGQQKIGSAMEKFLLSNINTVSYKNFSLNVQVDAKVGGTLVSATHQYTTTTGQLTNTLYGRDLEHGGVQYTDATGAVRTDGIIPDGVLADGIKSINPDTPGKDLGGMTYADAVAAGDLLPISARLYYRNISNWAAGIREYSAFENSWVSLREVSLGYNFPASLVNKVKLQTLRLSVTGRNLAYLYRSLPYDLNPESLKSNSAGEFSEYGGLPFSRQMGFSLTAGF